MRGAVGQRAGAGHSPAMVRAQPQRAGRASASWDCLAVTYRPTDTENSEMKRLISCKNVV